jgi:hypothetical protein
MALTALVFVLLLQRVDEVSIASGIVDERVNRYAYLTTIGCLTCASHHGSRGLAQAYESTRLRGSGRRQPDVEPPQDSSG